MDPETSFTQIYSQSDADKSASGMASGSQDPSFTPGSTTELPSRPGVQDTAVGRVLPFSQVAPGFDTPIPIGVSTAPSGTGAAGAAAAAGASTGAVTGSSQWTLQGGQTSSCGRNYPGCTEKFVQRVHCKVFRPRMRLWEGLLQIYHSQGHRSIESQGDLKSFDHE